MPTHYETLGVDPDATEHEIKRAYRALSLKLHPDRNPDPAVAELYKSVNDANDILSDPEKRQQYDMELKFGAQGPGFDGFNGHPFGGFGGAQDIFSMLFGQGGPPGGGMPGIHVFHGGMPFQGFPGGPHNPQQHPFFQQFHPPQQPQAKPIEKTMCISLETAFQGGTIPVEIERRVIHNGNGVFENVTMQIDIPRGIDADEKIVIKGKGHMVTDTNVGDVVITVQIKEDLTFYRKGMNLHYSHIVTLKEALCGFAFDLKHISGKTFHLNNTQNHTIIKPGYTKTIPGLGMVKDSPQSATGNLVIVFGVDFPQTLTPEQVEGLRSIL